jgi:DNA polymerase III gamma/tau subunit
MRDAISLLDQMTAEGSVTADYVRLMLGAERREVVQSLVKAWLDQDMKEGLAIINRAMDGGADPRQLARQTSDFLRGLLLIRLGSGAAWTDPTDEERPRFTEMAHQTELGRLVEAVQLFSDVVSQRFTGWQPQLPLELAFVEASMEKATQSPARGSDTTTTGATQVQTARATSSQPSTYQPKATATTPKRVNERTDEATDEPASTSPTTRTGSALSAEQIRDQWRDILQQMRKAESLKSIAALLHGGQPMGYNANGALVIGFRHTFHRNKVNTDENRIAVENFLSDLFNTPFHVRCELEKEVQTGLSSTPPATTASEKKDNAEPSPSPSKARANGPSAKAQAKSPPPEPPVESWEEDELIKRAKRELGAEVRQER